jgi:sulfur-oxidizing protein SoxZ
VSIRLKAYNEKGITVVKALIKHPMARPSSKTDEKGDSITTLGHFIEEVIFEHQGKPVMSALLSGGVSKNPFLAFKFKGGTVGETVKLSWTDNQGESGETEVQIS